jgi:hypothetical protein
MRFNYNLKHVSNSFSRVLQQTDHHQARMSNFGAEVRTGKKEKGKNIKIYGRLTSRSCRCSTAFLRFIPSSSASFLLNAHCIMNAFCVIFFENFMIMRIFSEMHY